MVLPWLYLHTPQFSLKSVFPQHVGLNQLHNMTHTKIAVQGEGTGEIEEKVLGGRRTRPILNIPYHYTMLIKILPLIIQQSYCRGPAPFLYAFPLSFTNWLKICFSKLRTNLIFLPNFFYFTVLYGRTCLFPVICYPFTTANGNYCCHYLSKWQKYILLSYLNLQSGQTYQLCFLLHPSAWVGMLKIAGWRPPLFPFPWAGTGDNGQSIFSKHNVLLTTCSIYWHLSLPADTWFHAILPHILSSISLYNY